jgi:SSS family solute:Na+ symporter
MKDLLPRGVLGLGVAAFIAVFISSANTMLMVVSATLTKDVYATFIDSKASERNLLRFGRLSTLIAGLGGWGLSYAIHDIITLSITALFLLLIFLPAIIGGFFWPRSTNSAAIASVVTGFVATVIGLRFLPTTAFVPAFMLSVVVFVAVSFRSDHGREETLIITTDREAR